MAGNAILVFSIALQAVAAGLAILLIRITKHRLAWSLVASAFALMAVRRAITFYDVALAGSPQHFNFRTELVALTISALLAAGMVAIVGFVRSLQRRQDQLREQERTLAEAQRISRVGSWEWDIGTDGVRWSDEHFRIFGYEPGAIRPSHSAFLDRVHPDDRDSVEREIDTARAERRPYDIEFRIVRPDGAMRTVNARGATILDKAGAPQRMLGTVQDISERRRAEALVTRLGRIVEDSVNEVYVFDAQSLRFIQVNRGARGNLGYSEEELRALTPVDLKPEFTRESFEDMLQPLREGTQKFLIFQTVHRRKDGTTYDVEVRLQLSHAENPPVFVAIIQDISDRLAMEEQLRHSQKMEAVGQLTGGVAHDFNNLLAVILGNLDALEEKVRDKPDLYALVRPAIRAVERGTALTARLLAFSRKQALRPRAVNLNDLMTNMVELLRRTLGATIAIEAMSGKDLWPCEVDPVQLENALLNLAVNARDAMPEGGKLTIETANVRLDDEYAAAQAEVIPGNYVVLAVSDTGAGMPPQVLKHVFEPFFTTKEVGKGTGLGLSMVYGFVKQSGGHVTIYSEPGKGTTVRIYLPRTRRVEAYIPPAEHAATDYRARDETILIVEDDPEVRSLAVMLLRELGYEVLDAGQGAAALAHLAENPRINLLLTDMVLPGEFSGATLAEEVRRRYPWIKVVYMSGYTEKAASRGGQLGSGEILLQKPFRRLELARTLRQALDEGRLP